MADKPNPRLAFQKLVRIADENGLPPVNEWQDVDFRRTEVDSDEWTLTVDTGGVGDHKATLGDGDLTINELFAAKEYTLGSRQPFDPGDITVDSPTSRGRRYSKAEIRERDEAMPTVAEAMKRADRAIGGRERIAPPVPEPGITDKIVKGVRKFINRIRARF